MINTVTIEGRLGKDPELVTFQSGTSKASFSIAVDNWSKEKGKQEPSWFSCECWGSLAVAVTDHCRKGALVIVSGRLQEQRWADKQSGENRSKTVIIANDVHFLKPVRFGWEDDNAAPKSEAAQTLDDDDMPF